jgi:FtsH-binding integral membrane protein
MEFAMANWNEPRDTRQGFGTSFGREGALEGRATYDTGLRKHMLSIYNYMASGVLLSGIVAILSANSATMMGLMATPLAWVFMLAPLAMVFAMSFGAARFSTATLQIMFWVFATLMGVSMSTIFLVFTNESIATTFFATAGAFAGLSLWGYTTKKDLSGWGSFLIMGVVGLLLASVINIFVGSSSLYWAISFLGVLIFAGLTAYDTQRLKEQYYQVAGSEWAGKAIILGALSLYLDFINMFQFLLNFMGSRE